MATRQTIAELLIEIGMDTAQAERQAKKIGDSIKGVGDKSKKAEAKVDRAAASVRKFGKAGEFAGKFANRLGLVLTGVTGIVVGLAKGVLQTGAKFESLEKQLKTATGSAEGARKAFAFIREFTAKTPFELEQVTNAFVKLKNFGLDPTERTMTAFGDFASAMGKDLDMFVEAVLDATTGEFERLKEFGIKTKQEGDKVKFTFRGITTEVEKNSADIQSFLVKAAETNFGGAMAEQAAIAVGKISNLKDAATEFLNTVSQMGPLEEFKGLIDDIQKAAGDKEGGLAKVLANLLVSAIRTVRRLVQGDFVPTLEKLVSVLGFLVDHFGKLVALFGAAKTLSAFTAASSGLASIGISAAAALGPIGAVTAALIALIPWAVEAGNAIGNALGKQPGLVRANRGERVLVASEIKQLPRRMQAEVRRAQSDITRFSSQLEGSLGDIERDIITQDLNKARRVVSGARGSLASERGRRTEEATEVERLRRESELENILGIDVDAGEGINARSLADYRIGLDAIDQGATVEEAVIAIGGQTQAEAQQAGELTSRKRGKKKKKKKDKGRPKSATTVSEFFGQAARGELGPIAEKTPSTREIEPTVAVDITNNNFTFTDTFHIAGTTDPEKTGTQIVKQIKREFDKRLASAGQQMQTNLVK